MFELAEELYAGSGEWGDPILIATGLLFVAGSFMLFVVRMVKRFLLFTIIALLLPNGIGIMGYIDEASDVEEVLVERGEELSDDFDDAMEGRAFSPLYLGLIGSVLAGSLGVAGMVRGGRKKEARPKET